MRQPLPPACAVRTQRSRHARPQSGSGLFRGDFKRCRLDRRPIRPPLCRGPRGGRRPIWPNWRRSTAPRWAETDRIAYDVFEYTQQRTLAQTAPDVLPNVLALPIDHFRGLHVFYPRFRRPAR